MSERKPLTLEELREMHNSSERIGTRVLLRVYSVTGIEGILDRREDDGICAVYAASGEWLKEKYYGKTWLAYAYEPPHLDRSEWEPCKSCESKCRTCLRNETSRCEKCNNYDCYYPVSNFCQRCGRPLTDAAWEMLEKRLESAK